MHVMHVYADLAKHDLARAGVDNQLQGGSINIQHHLAVGDTTDGQAKPQWPVCNLLECLQRFCLCADPPLSA